MALLWMFSSISLTESWRACLYQADICLQLYILDRLYLCVKKHKFICKHKVPCWHIYTTSTLKSVWLVSAQSCLVPHRQPQRSIPTTLPHNLIPLYMQQEIILPEINSSKTALENRFPKSVCFVFHMCVLWTFLVLFLSFHPFLNTTVEEEIKL